MKKRTLLFLLEVVVQAVRALARTRADLVLENLALRQQVAALARERPRPNLDDCGRGFWVALRSRWSAWASPLVIVKPATVVDWHHRRFSRHWTRISQARPRGRPRITRELRELIVKMAGDGWGAPRVHGELLKLGFSVSETTVSRYMPRRPVEPDQVNRWLAFLRNHKDGIAAMDFFTVPTARLRILYCWFVIEHGRRTVLHFNATFNPTPAWVMQQLREAFPFDTAPRHLIFDRDSIFSKDVVRFVRTMGTKPCRTAFRCPWQNPVAERWIGGARRDLFDHVVVLNERHAVRLGRRYVEYHREDRTHLGLEKETPGHRPTSPKPSSSAKVVALPRLGGLHHRYEWRDAA
jgi:putative transposase